MPIAQTPYSILLISCYELGHQPLGVAWASAFLRQAGFAPRTLDVSTEGFQQEMALGAQFIGISVPMHTALSLGVRVAQRIRGINPSCHICFLGLYATLNAEFLLASVADSVIGGEYEAALVPLVESLALRQSKEIAGVSRTGTLQAPVLQRLSFPLPARDTLPGLESYARLEKDGERLLAGHVEASRGCLHLCLHCPIPPVYGGRFFVVPQAIVLEDIRRQVEAGAKHITFGDPDFLNGPGHSLAIVRKLHREFPEITFDFTAKIEHLLKHRSIFPELAEKGCLFVISAVESLSDDVLRRLHKGHTRKDVEEALAILRRSGISLRSSWVAFTPWTTLQDYVEMLEFIEKEDLVDHIDPVHLSIRLLIPPGSALLSQGDMKSFLKELDQANFCYPWNHPDPRMDALYQEVRKVVALAAGEKEDAWITFQRIKRLAAPAHGEVSLPDSARKRPPRLSETWFCCAEPTEGQVASVNI